VDGSLVRIPQGARARRDQRNITKDCHHPIRGRFTIQDLRTPANTKVYAWRESSGLATIWIRTFVGHGEGRGAKRWTVAKASQGGGQTSTEAEFLEDRQFNPFKKRSRTKRLFRLFRDIRLPSQRRPAQPCRKCFAAPARLQRSLPCSSGAGQADTFCPAVFRVEKIRDPAPRIGRFSQYPNAAEGENPRDRNRREPFASDLREGALPW